MNIKRNYQNIKEAKEKLEKILEENNFDPILKANLQIVICKMEMTKINLEIEMKVENDV